MPLAGAGHGADAAPLGQPLWPLAPSGHALHLFRSFPSMPGQVLSASPSPRTSGLLRLFPVPSGAPSSHPLLLWAPPGPYSAWVCMSPSCSAAPGWTGLQLSRASWAVVPPLPPSTHQVLCIPLSLPSLDWPDSGPRMPLRATLNPLHKAPSSLRPAWISSSSRKPSGLPDTRWRGPAQETALRTIDWAFTSPCR